MKLIIDIPEEIIEYVQTNGCLSVNYDDEIATAIKNGTLIPDNVTNGEVIKAMFGDDKVSEFMYHTRILAKVGNWFNECVVAEFDNVWLNAPYQKGGKE